MATVGLARRSHRKSRTGCLQCKQRKVKCDEHKPSCRNCTRRDVPCAFAELPRPIQSSHAVPTVAARLGYIRESDSPATSLASSDRNQEPASQLSMKSSQAGLDIFDMELLHHYMTTTSYTLSRAPAVQEVWRDEVPRIAFNMPGVLHAMLAVSALHLACSNPSRTTSCIARAHLHHNAAVQDVTPNVQSLASENSAGLFIFSSLTCIFACANAQSTFLVLFEHGHLSEWALLFRGAKTVMDYTSQDFHEGRLGPMFMHGTNISMTRRSAEALQQGLMFVRELKQMISRECLHDLKLSQVYEETLEGLARTLGVAMKPFEGRILQTSDVFAWLLEVPNIYLELLRQEAPVAIVIFGYFCVALWKIESMWWMKGLSSRLMTQLNSVLSEDYRSWLQWPKDQIGWTLPRSV